jgi:GNAT superfamily N-acetyltransferase
MKTSKTENAKGQTDTNAVQIRISTNADVSEITRLLWDDEQGRKRESISPENATVYQSAFEQIERDPNSQVFVATLEGAVIGCLQLTVIPGLSYRGVRRALIEDVRVAGSVRGRGVGGLLLGHAEAHVIKLGCKLVELFVHGQRTNAHRFYEKAGYIGAHRGFRKELNAA